MRKIRFSLLTIFISAACFSQEVGEQEPFATHRTNETLLKIAKNYFRSNPFQNEFGWFLKHLMNDPLLINKTINKRTDSSLFFFQAEYKNYSPFGFLSDRTEMRLAEKDFIVNDSLSVKDTLFIYQLLGYSYNGKSGMETVKEEFSKFNRRYGKHFTAQSSDIKMGTEIVGTTQDYFVTGFAVAPLSVAWVKFDEFQNAFVITLRFKR